ncbi:MAG: hypothetical protein IPM98_15690 [Lewinellaceae bacterium]|nr:hypothetical protein [Lewinellaceae bacterium]
MTVTAPVPVDLEVIGAGALPDTIFSGQTVGLQWTVRNNGSSTATGLWNFYTWNDAAYISSDSIWSGDDALLRDFPQSGPLLSGATYIDNKTFQIPKDIFGNYYMLLVTDRAQYTNDNLRANNVQTVYPAANPYGDGPVKTIHIKLSPTPDLVANSMTVPTAGLAGQPVKFYWTVTNMGPGLASGAWTDKFYLSTDIALDNSDQVFATKAQNRMLAAGEFYTDSVEFAIPASLSGNYILFLKPMPTTTCLNTTAKGTTRSLPFCPSFSRSSPI